MVLLEERRAIGLGQPNPATPYFEIIEYILPLTAVYAAPRLAFESIPGVPAINFSYSRSLSGGTLVLFFGAANCRFSVPCHRSERTRLTACRARVWETHPPYPALHGS